MDGLSDNTHTIHEYFALKTDGLSYTLQIQFGLKSWITSIFVFTEKINVPIQFYAQRSRLYISMFYAMSKFALKITLIKIQYDLKSWTSSILAFTKNPKSQML